MKKLLLSLLLISPALIYAQQFTMADIPLKWKHFTIKKGIRHSHVAKISRQVLLSYRYKEKNEQGKRPLIVAAELVVDKDKSWIKKEYLDAADPALKDALLNHEKGHLAISLKWHRKLQQTFSDFKFSKRVRIEMDSLYNIVRENADEENERYDRETNHMLNVDKQAQWEQKIFTELNDLYADDKILPMKFEVETVLYE